MNKNKVISNTRLKYARTIRINETIAIIIKYAYVVYYKDRNAIF